MATVLFDEATRHYPKTPKPAVHRVNAANTYQGWCCPVINRAAPKQSDTVEPVE